MLKTGGALNY